MGESQRDYLQLLANRFMSFNLIQMKYFNLKMKDRAMTKHNLTATDIQTDLFSMVQDGKDNF